VLLNPYLGFGASSVGIRAASAIDIAVWDLLGNPWVVLCTSC